MVEMEKELGFGRNGNGEIGLIWKLVGMEVMKLGFGRSGNLKLVGMVEIELELESGRNGGLELD